VVREEFVDAAFRALGKFGPDVSMDDIAEEAGTAATVSSLAESTARLTGMTVDPNLPLHLAFSSDETSQ
jgi:hypothetical protein